jgi:hypothetical protein
VLSACADRPAVAAHDAFDAHRAPETRPPVADVRDSGTNLWTEVLAQDVTTPEEVNDVSEVRELDACLPDCTAKQCGDDGCGWNCGTCDALRVCEEGLCRCTYGDCYAAGPLGAMCSGIELGHCDEWSCVDSCCTTVTLPMGECCFSGLDCRDCIHLETEEVVACADAIPEGFVENLCTLNPCLDNRCTLTDKVEAGLCDDNEMYTVDTCDPVTGECSHVQCPPEPG